jgi:hypothetical protein
MMSNTKIILHAAYLEISVVVEENEMETGG